MTRGQWNRSAGVKHSGSTFLGRYHVRLEEGLAMFASDTRMPEAMHDFTGCTYTRHPRGDTMPKDRCARASLLPQRFARQRYPRMRLN